MRKCLYILVFFIAGSIDVFGQLQAYCIKGNVKEPDINTYAYLFINRSGKISPSIVCAPITDHKFRFDGSIDLRGRQIATGFIFISDKKDLDTIQVIKMLDSGLRDQRDLVLENLEIDIDNRAEIRDADVRGSKLNKDWDEMFNANKTGKHFDYVRDHNDSPVSILLISALISLERMRMIAESELNQMYSMLSERMKGSSEGKQLKSKLLLTFGGNK